MSRPPPLPLSHSSGSSKTHSHSSHSHQHPSLRKRQQLQQLQQEQQQQQNQHQHQQQKSSPPTTQQTRHHVFTCTFCWRLSAGQPRVLGRSARLACGPCYKALLDLAICWVCGEMVVRRDECVSLGWCFWHRACYGCLLCGSRLVARGLSVAEIFADDGAEETEREVRRRLRRKRDRRGSRERLVGGEEEEEDMVAMGTGRGREIAEVPLCANCLVEVDIDGLDERSVVQKGLRKVDRVEGGLSRQRWEARESEKFPERNIHLHRRLYGRSILGDGAGSESADLMEQGGGAPSTVYVSMLDPIGKMAFRPSPTKPIPDWMRPAGDYPVIYIPDPEPDRQHKRPAGPDASASKHSSRTSTICPTASSKQSNAPSRSVSPTQSVSSDVSSRGHRPAFQHRGMSFVSTEPLLLPSSQLMQRVNNDANFSSSTLSTYFTPPEYLSPPASHGTRSTESLPDVSHGNPRPDPLFSGRSSGYSSHVSRVRRPESGQVTRESSHHSLRRVEKSSSHRSLQRSTTQLHRVASHTVVPLTVVPLSSSEFLKRYRKGSSPPVSPSVVVSSREANGEVTPFRRESNNNSNSTNVSINSNSTPFRGHLMAKMRRNSRAEPSAGQVTEETALATTSAATDIIRSRQSLRGNGGEKGGQMLGDLRNTTKRRSVQAELKRLFGR
ncbi:hypothetical protein B0H63DRAFT_564974 [Podospora didyma]|uniref:LIM zinc-binding domain-containing protein n=1 Tax=Podospora didyma TaxID=330526 RepID=A0AAE0N3N8_9PEZI|nr:hypothetical protein B0H63DRAFT_564974 [Podospora didyma]